VTVKRFSPAVGQAAGELLKEDRAVMLSGNREYVVKAMLEAENWAIALGFTKGIQSLLCFWRINLWH
jgi:hypothetical protein